MLSLTRIKKENYAYKEDSVEETEESQHTLRRSGGVRSMAVHFCEPVMVVAENLMTDEEDMRRSEKKRWKLVLKEELDFLEWNIAWIQTVLQLGKDAVLCEGIMKMKLDEKRGITPYKTAFVAKMLSRRTVLNMKKRSRQSYHFSFSFPKRLHPWAGMSIMLIFAQLFWRKIQQWAVHAVRVKVLQTTEEPGKFEAFPASFSWEAEE